MTLTTLLLPPAAPGGAGVKATGTATLGAAWARFDAAGAPLRGTGTAAVGGTARLREGAAEAAPVESILGDELFARLTPVHQGDTKALRVLCRAATRVMEETDRFANDDGAPVGWAAALDPDLAPTGSLGWLAMFTGAPGDVKTRQGVKDGWILRRGRPASIRIAMAQTLTGTRRVILTERYQGSAWRLLAQTYSVETPSPAETEAVFREHVPMGVIGTFQVIGGQTVGDIEGRYPTVGDAETAYATVGDAESDTP